MRFFADYLRFEETIARFGGKGGGQNSTVTQVQQTNPAAQAAYQNAVNTGTAVAGQPYPTYPGSLVAGFNPEQQAAFSNINNAAGLGQPYIDQAAKLIQASTSGINPGATQAQYMDPAVQGYLGQANQFATQAGQPVDPSQTVGKYTNPNLAGQLGAATQFTTQAGQGINPLGGQYGVQSFMSPYTQDVLHSQMALQNQQDAVQQQQLVGQAVGAGAFGGDRAAIAQSTLAGQQALANNAANASTLQQGYGQALQAALQTGTTNAQLGMGAGAQIGQLANIGQNAYQQSLGTGLSAAQLSGQLGLGAAGAIGQQAGQEQQAYQGALGTGLSSQEANAWLASNGAYGMGNLGQMSQNLAMSGANSQLQIGGLGQQLAQEQLNIPYSQWQQAQAYPYQISNFEMGLATGAGGAGATASTTSPGPSIASQIAGLGVTGLAAYNAYNQGTGGFGTGGTGGVGQSAGAAQSVPLYNFGVSGATNPGASFASNPWTSTGYGANGGRFPRERHYQAGGTVPMDGGIGAPLGLGAGPSTPGLSPAMQAGLGSGNPLVGGQMQQLNNLPTEKLHEMAVRLPPGTPQGQLVQTLLRRRQMMPQSAPQPAQPQGLGATGLPGMQAGGTVPFANWDAPDPSDSYQGDPEATFHGDIIPPRYVPPPAGEWPAAAVASEDVPRETTEPRGLSPIRLPPVAAAGNVSAAPRGYLDIVAGNESSNGRNVNGPMTDSGQAQGRYQITTGTWRDFAPKAGVDLKKFPTPLAAPDDVQTAVANVIPISRWAPSTVRALQAAYPDMDITQPLGSIAAGGSEAEPSFKRGLGAGEPIIVGQNSTEQQPAGLGAQAAEPSFMDRLTSGGNGALLAAGLGILSGSSPFASVNIGKGGLQALQFTELQKARAAQLAETQARIQQTGEYQKGELDLRKLGLSQQTANEAANRDLKRAEIAATADYRHDVLDQGRFTYQPWQQPDPNDATKMISGVMQMPTRGGEPKFIPTTGMPVNKADPLAAQFNTTGAAATNVHGDDYLKTLAPNIGSQVRALADGRMPFPSGFALKSPYWQQMLSAVSQYDPSFDAINYNARNRTNIDFKSGQSSKVVGALNTVMPHLEVLNKSFDALGNGQFPSVNAVWNWAAQQGLRGSKASAAPTNASEAVSAVASEMRRVFQASGGGSLTELENWERNFPVNGTPAQQKGAIQQAIVLMDSRLSALGDIHDRGMSTTEEPMNLLSATARASYQHLTGREPQTEVTTRNPAAGTAAAPAAATKAAPSLADLPDGTIVTQGDRRYLKQNGKMILQP